MKTSESGGEGESIGETEFADSFCLSPSSVEKTIESEIAILNEPEAEPLADNYGFSDSDSRHDSVDDAISDVFGDDTDRDVNATPAELQLMTDGALDQSGV